MQIENIAIVITSIANSDNKVLIKYAKECEKRNIRLIIIGDEKSPKKFFINGCDYYSLKEQLVLDFEYPKKCPRNHYARKNIGYLLAIKDNAKVIIETDDDNYPYADFWIDRSCMQRVPIVTKKGWVNVYTMFSDKKIWPRGFPLEEINNKDEIIYDKLETKLVKIPIQQGLANNNPDVDAIYRLTSELPISFYSNRKVALGKGSWCPFNSQNTTWWEETYPLLYLPSTCSFRMTDIWRSFIAQRIAWENDWFILFEKPTVKQTRNVHNLLKDFKDEIPGYISNKDICNKLNDLEILPGIQNIKNNMVRCYMMFSKEGWVKHNEINLLKSWLKDLSMIRRREELS